MSEQDRGQGPATPESSGAPTPPPSAPDFGAPAGGWGTPPPDSAPVLPPYGTPSPFTAAPTPETPVSDSTLGYPTMPDTSGSPAVPDADGRAPDSGTDGIALASLITGVVGTGPVALVLGIIGLRRTGPGKKGGRGFAIAGTILGGLGTLGWIVGLILILTAVNAVNNAVQDVDDAWSQSTQDLIAEYAAGCRDGDMMDCDSLAIWAETGSEEDDLAQSCNGLGDRGEAGSCYVLGLDAEKATSYGDDDDLDALYDSCAAGDMTACDDLYYDAPYTSSGTSEYREFAESCGDSGLTAIGGMCEYEQDKATDTGEATTPDTSGSAMNAEAALDLMQILVDGAAAPEASQNYGDNHLLDKFWDECSAGDDNQCGWLYLTSPEGSGYRAHAETCGGRGAKPGVCAP